MNYGKLLIADLGLSKKLAEVSTNSKANKLGMVEYIDPQLYKSAKFKKNKKSDIYSLGVLLWEISSGHPPFPNCERDILHLHIRDGHREKPVKGTPPKYRQLYQECWDGEPNSRPDIEKVYKTLSQLKTEDSLNLQSSQKNYLGVSYNNDLTLSTSKSESKF